MLPIKPRIKPPIKLPVILPNPPRTTTMIAIMVSKDDPSVGRRHAEYYHDRLLKSGTPILRFDVLPGELHLPSGVPAGAELLEKILLNECHPRQEIPAVSAPD